VASLVLNISSIGVRAFRSNQRRPKLPVRQLLSPLTNKDTTEEEATQAQSVALSLTCA